MNDVPQDSSAQTVPVPTNVKKNILLHTLDLAIVPILVFVGSISSNVYITAVTASLIVALAKFRSYFQNPSSQNQLMMFFESNKFIVI
jgi:heme O synthase-like polyprenyltransferase